MPNPTRERRRPRRSRPGQSVLFLALLLVLLSGQANALLKIDFECPYYVHPGMQVWDFCLIQEGGLYQIFYHGILEEDNHPRHAHHIYRATSEDLRHWSAPEIVLSISDEPHEAEAIWAPDVVFDDETGLWWMAYTGVDLQFNQRICMAWSRDLATWYKSRANPVMEPDPSLFFYFPSSGWAECRDPYLYREDGQWHMLASAKIQGMQGGQGALAHASSTDLLNWSPTDVFMINDGTQPGHTLESSQYHEREDRHHVFFLEYDVQGISYIGAASVAELSFERRTIIDLGIAPEVDSFDGGEHHVFSRLAPYRETGASVLSYCVRLDTLRYQSGTLAPAVFRANPLDRDWEVHSGNMCLGNPCFGDNPARRGEEPAGPVGQFYFGSNEYFQGPLSGRGDPGRDIGNSAMGLLKSYPFTIEGNSISLLVGGDFNPDSLYVALADVATDTLLRVANGLDSETMTPRYWDVQDLQGQEVYVTVVDIDPFGHINVDEIIESHTEFFTGVEPAMPSSLVQDLGPMPNPFNPATDLRFVLATPAACRVSIHDLRGRLVWDSGPVAGREGLNSVRWNGTDRGGVRAAGGLYVYRIEVDGSVTTGGKLTLAP